MYVCYSEVIEHCKLNFHHINTKLFQHVLADTPRKVSDTKKQIEDEIQKHEALKQELEQMREEHMLEVQVINS